MGFSAKQVQALRRNLDARHVRTREANGRELSYIEGWYAISEANRIFGFDGWNRETVESRCVLARENRGTFLAVYIAKVRITVQRRRDDHYPRRPRHRRRPRHLAGRGPRYCAQSGRDRCHQTSAGDFRQTVWTRALSQGQELSLAQSASAQPAAASAPAQPRVGLHPDDTTPIPRPSHYYGRRHQSSMTELLRQDQEQSRAKDNVAAPPLAPAVPARGTGQDRQEPTRHRRTKAPARQGPSEIRGLTTVSHLRAQTIRPSSSALCATASDRSQGQ